MGGGGMCRLSLGGEKGCVYKTEPNYIYVHIYLFCIKIQPSPSQLNHLKKFKKIKKNIIPKA